MEVKMLFGVTPDIFDMPLGDLALCIESVARPWLLPVP
jgi:hypothetical protein